MSTPTPSVQSEIDAVIIAGGRQFNGGWLSAYTSMSCNCSGAIEDQGQRHDLCHGWIAPILGARECICPCHDANRLNYDAAKAETLAALAAAKETPAPIVSSWSTYTA